MKNLIERDKSIRKICKLFEHKKLILKNITNNTNFSRTLRWKSFEKLFIFPVKSSLSQINNRCVLTGRKKRINKLYSFSRIIFLKLVRSGKITGLKKSSW